MHLNDTQIDRRCRLILSRIKKDYYPGHLQFDFRLASLLIRKQASKGNNAAASDVSDQSSPSDDSHGDHAPHRSSQASGKRRKHYKQSGAKNGKSTASRYESEQSSQSDDSHSNHAPHRSSRTSAKRRNHRKHTEGARALSVAMTLNSPPVATRVTIRLTTLPLPSSKHRKRSKSRKDKGAASRHNPDPSSDGNEDAARTSRHRPTTSRKRCKRKLEGEDEKNEEPEDSDDLDQDTFATTDGKPWAEAAMAWLKLIHKHQFALSSLIKEKIFATDLYFLDPNTTQHFESVSLVFPQRFSLLQIVMSEPFSDKEKSNMDTALHSSRPAMPFIEEDEDVGAKIKTEDASQKRPLEEDDARDVKKPKEMYLDEDLAYGGEPVQKYNGEIPYNFNIHECLPEHEVNSRHHKENFNFHGKKLTPPLLAELEKYTAQDDELKNFYNNFAKKRIFSKPGAIRYGLIGPTGAGKSTLINTLNSVGSLSTESAASRSSTQVAIVFANALQENFQIFVSIFHEITIKNMLRQCLQEIMVVVQTPVSERVGQDYKEASQDATASLLILRSLITSLKAELKNLRAVEKFLSNNPMVNRDDTSKLVDHFLALIQQRAVDNGVDWENRRMRVSALNAEDVNRKIQTFAEPDGLASIVSQITIRFRSALLAQGIEVVDLPGLNDNNTLMRDAAIQVLKNCHKIIVVTPMERFVSNQDLKNLLNMAIDLKRIENVILVIRGREEYNERNMERSLDLSDAEEKAFETLQDDLTDAKDKLKELRFEGTEDEDAYKDQVRKVDKLEQKLYLMRLEIRDRLFNQSFARDYEDINGRQLRMMTVSGVAYKEHSTSSASTRKPYLPVEETNIPKLRDLLCKEHGNAEVETFKDHLEVQKKYARQLLIWIDPENLPSRDAVIAIFNSQLSVSLGEEAGKLRKVVSNIRSNLRTIFITTWPSHIEDTLKKYRELRGATIGACIKKKGVHIPSNKDEIRMNKDFVRTLDNDLKPSVKSLCAAIDAASGSAIEKTRSNINDLRSKLEQSDCTGALDLDAILDLFQSEETACIRDIEACCKVYKEDTQVAIAEATADKVLSGDGEQSAFVDCMDLVYERCFKTYPPKWKGKGRVTDVRLAYIREALLSKPGPFSKLSDDISTRLDQACSKWSCAVEKRIKTMRSELERVLSRSFGGKEMPAEERVKIGPSLKAVAKTFISEIDGMLSKYKSPAVKVQQAGPEDDLFMAE
ncbi:hypothetical protein KCU77_g2236, partial [Aureobasidium melanogenum]